MPRRAARKEIGRNLWVFGVFFFICAVTVLLVMQVILPAALSSLSSLIEVQSPTPSSGGDSSFAILASVIVAAFLTLLLVSIVWLTRQNGKSIF
jgi:uncharacterized membrane protein YdbT with pleckstrin-like domain